MASFTVPWTSLPVRVSRRSLSVRPGLFRDRRALHSDTKVAVLYQAIEPPVVGGVRKPAKPGGYQDSGADIAYVLKNQCKIPVTSPTVNPDPSKMEGWCYPDHEDGLLSAVKSGGATTLWANTILFAEHPLQTSSKLSEHESDLSVIGQPPALVQAYDDKALVNDVLRRRGVFTLPAACLTSTSDKDELQALLSQHEMQLPVVGKPIRGRGSHGVKVCRTVEELVSHASSILKESPLIMLEQFLSATEGTVTVMPPSADRPDYWSLPVVLRFNHADGIAPYNGAVAVSANSRCASQKEHDSDPAFAKIQRECEDVARLLRVKAPIRVDVRRSIDQHGAPFHLFDVNMKPNMTAPGRPGRENQASLTAMAATGLGWDTPTLLTKILETASTLKVLRSTELPEEFAFKGRQ